MRRFTRLTNAFSKKLGNHMHAISLYFMFYNFCKIHNTDAAGHTSNGRRYYRSRMELGRGDYDGGYEYVNDVPPVDIG